MPRNKEKTKNTMCVAGNCEYNDKRNANAAVLARYHYYTVDNGDFISRQINLPRIVHHSEEFSMSQFYDLITFRPHYTEYKNDDKYVDTSFKPSEKSIYGLKGKRSFSIGWTRGEDLTNGKLLYTKISPEDVTQSHLGDCWFIAAVTCLAEKPELIERIFPNKNVSDVGRYELNLHKNGRPVTVFIDSLIPIQTYTGKPLGCYSQSNQLWVLLLEKAYAKLHGSYFALNSGSSHEAFQDLTGYPSDLIPKEIRNSPNFFEYLSKGMRKGILVTAAVDGKQPGHGAKAMLKKGIITNHAYSIIETDENIGKDGGLVQLVKLRNPWNSFEFDEKLSGQKENWTPEIKSQMHLCCDKNDGEFWMDFKDFRELFSVYSYCNYRPDWKIVPLSFEFKAKSSGSLAPIFNVKVPFGQELKVLSLHQKDTRIENAQPYVDISAFIFKVTNNNEDNSFSVRSDLKCVGYLENVIEHTTLKDLSLCEGEYLIVPYTSGTLMALNGNISKEATLNLYFASTKNSKNSSRDFGEIKNMKDYKYLSAPPDADKIPNYTTKATKEIEIKKLPDTTLKSDEVKRLCLESFGEEDIEDSKMSFKTKLLLMEGMVLYGLQKKSQQGGSSVFTVHTRGCVNMMPTLDSLVKNDRQKVVIPESNRKKLKVLGAFVRINNKECHFGIDIDLNS